MIKQLALAAALLTAFTGTAMAGKTLDTIKQTIRQASDIREDGTNAAGVPCNAISIGLGFTGKRIGQPKTVAVDEAPPPDPCTAGDGGTDGG